MGFFLLGRAPRVAAAWLGLASVYFYGYWMPEYVVLLLVSIIANYGFGVIIGRLRDRAGGPGEKSARIALIFGLIFNLGLLSWFKYANFLLDTLRTVTVQNLPVVEVILPIGISFFTFTQIAFLVDTFTKGTREYRFIHYLLFVTYFPHLIAGPVLHHAQMMPQFADPEIYRPQIAKIAAGLGLFALGLIKKIVLADGIAPYANAVFDATAAGYSPTAFEAWIGAVAYTLQLYFDFSGYSDMAVGLSMIFGVRLPFNFASPYRATNISEFWRRWHMTLSAFLRDYLYIPLGGNRHGNLRRVINLMVTMLLGGLWHGASWTFVVWGGLHGLYLVAHHSVGNVFTRYLARLLPRTATVLVAWLITMLAVIVAWVFFRAVDFTSASTILSAMFSIVDTDSFPKILFNAGLDTSRGLWLILTWSLVAVLPMNSNNLFDRHLRICMQSHSVAWFSTGAAVTMITALITINELRTSTSPFIYFNF
ncbi:MAG: Peptidoglycan O-acetyltransferase [Nitrosomonas europaea]|uniref:MBOAT family O-acyltransferase n=2 Tax=Nitrosomonas TaxID=914 RepID=UPI0023F566F7|nr:MBOAT family protein [Nitrosomonas europaea]MBV6390602.1 Peptidoglycan O-acetyltransferase [Nitrosomonas europaea]